MKNYLKLKISSPPLKNPNEIVNMAITGGYNLRLPGDVLTSELLEEFRQMGLKPKFVTIFGRNDSVGLEETRMIHSDIRCIGGSTVDKSSWKSILFGINWEILGSQNTFSWWNMDGVPEAWPDEELSPNSKYKILNGIHFVERGHLGVPDGAQKIDETAIDGPTLVRTDIPHMTVYSNPNIKRVGISVRFNEDGFGNWGDVYNYFTKYSVQ